MYNIVCRGLLKDGGESCLRLIRLDILRKIQSVPTDKRNNFLVFFLVFLNVYNAMFKWIY